MRQVLLQLQDIFELSTVEFGAAPRRGGSKEGKQIWIKFLFVGCRWLNCLRWMYLGFERVDQIVQESGALWRRWLGVGETVEAGDAEADSVATLAAVHVVAQRQNDLEQLLELLAARHFLGRLHDGRDLGLDLADRHSELLLVEQRVQPLLVVSYPARSTVSIWVIFITIGTVQFQSVLIIGWIGWISTYLWDSCKSPIVLMVITNRFKYQSSGGGNWWIERFERILNLDGFVNEGQMDETGWLVVTWTRRRGSDPL